MLVAMSRSWRWRLVVVLVLCGRYTLIDVMILVQVSLFSIPIVYDRETSLQTTDNVVFVCVYIT